MTEDFDGVVFQIEFKKEDGTWSELNLDAYPPQRGFSASDPCWQRTGLHGVFTETQARRALGNLAAKAPSERLRIVMRVISVENQPLVEMGPAR